MVNSINEPALRRGIPMTRTISDSGDHMRRNASWTKTRGPAFLMSNVLLTGSGKADVKINSRVVSRRKTTLKTPAFSAILALSLQRSCHLRVTQSGELRQIKSR